MIAKPRVEHVAVRVRDLEGYLDFFQNVMGMAVTEEQRATDGTVKQVWVGGMQLQRDDTFDPALREHEQMTHIGIDVDDVDALLEKVYACEGITQHGENRNWFALPDGPVIELVSRP